MAESLMQLIKKELKNVGLPDDDKMTQEVITRLEKYVSGIVDEIKYPNWPENTQIARLVRRALKHKYGGK